MNDFALALDFGTSTTFIAVPGVDPTILPIGTESGNSWMPSVAATADGVVWELGENADSGSVVNQFRSLKTAITLDTATITNPAGVKYSADELIIKLLGEVKRRCAQIEGFSEISQVRLTCPAMWNGTQRARLARLVMESGLSTDLDSIIDEPIAASISWWWSRTKQGLRIDSKKRAVIFDFGGGTLDVAVVDLFPGVGSSPELTILAARGINLAGDSLDRNLANYITERLKQERNFLVHTQNDKNVVEAAILLASRRVKEELSSKNEVIFWVDEKIADIPSIAITRVELNDVFSEQMKQCISCVEATLREARMKSSDNPTGPSVSKEDVRGLAEQVDFVVLAGGMSQIPKVEEDLQEFMVNATVEFATVEKASSTTSIVLGVANENNAIKINIHRPNFNIVCVYQNQRGDEKRVILYPAFEPLYSSDQILRGDFGLGYQKEWCPNEEPKRGEVYLRAESLGGRSIPLRDSATGESVEDTFGANPYQPLNMKIYADGRIHISDSNGKVKTMRIRDWPYIRWNLPSNSREAAIKIETYGSSYQSDKSQDWWRLK